MTHRRRDLTDEQRAKAEQRRAQFTTLARQIADMDDGQRAVMAERMAGAVTVEGRRLSVHNACLLACQCPDATMVGGFNQWKTHGRVVRKGRARPDDQPAVAAAGAEGGGGMNNTEATITDAREIERLASSIIGRFFAACGGRHHYGRTCDYCLAEDVLRAARALLARVDGVIGRPYWD